jgi:signal transduction histidine kinase
MSSLPFALLVPGPPGHRGSAVRDRVADIIAVGSALAFGAVMVPLGDATKPGAAIPWPVDVAIGVLGAVLLLQRRRRPLFVCLVLLPLGAISVMVTGAILVALFTAGIRLRPRLLVLLGIVHIATGAIYFLLQHNPPMAVWVDLLLRAVTGFAAIGWGLFLQAHRRLTQSLRLHAQQLEAEQNLRVDRARLTERASIAREMHDVLAHRMSMVSLHAGALEVRTEDATPEELSAAARAIRMSAHEALDELRSVIGVLRQEEPPRPEPPQPELTDLADLLANARTSGMAIDFVSLVPPGFEPRDVGRTAYRVVQEALTNASKHAPGSEVEVLLDRPSDDLHIRVINRLHGEPPRDDVPGAGTGLIGIGERVALAGGHVEYGPEDDRFRLEAWLPWHR